MSIKDKLDFWNTLHRDSTVYTGRTLQAPLMHYRAKNFLARWIEKNPREFFLVCFLFAIAVVVVAR